MKAKKTYIRPCIATIKTDTDTALMSGSGEKMGNLKLDTGDSDNPEAKEGDPLPGGSYIEDAKKGGIWDDDWD